MIPKSETADHLEPDELYGTKEAAIYTKLSESTLAKKRMDGSGPEYLKIGKSVRYYRSGLDRWLDSLRHQNTSQYKKS